MNKNVLIGITGVVVAGIGFGIYKVMNKKEDKVEEVVKENVAETSTKDNDFMDKMMKEYEEDSKTTENWDRRNEKIKEELAEKESLNDQNMFEDKVTDSKEFAAINAMREAAGKEPLEIPKEFEKFLGIDLNKAEEILNKCSAKNKDAIDNIAEGIKKDPELKKRVLNILQE